MMLLLTSTPHLTSINGVAVRLWEGETSKGVKVKVFIHRLVVQEEDDQDEFQKELLECMPPGSFVPLAALLP